MRFASSRGARPRLRELVAALDEDGFTVGETWRRVADAAALFALPRPSYPHVRRLVRDERRRRAASRELNDTLKRAAADIAAGRVPSYDFTLGRLLDARAALAAANACVSETQGDDDAD